jgi:uncharacterized protein YsxB (DUF464 family)
LIGHTDCSGKDGDVEASCFESQSVGLQSVLNCLVVCVAVSSVAVEEVLFVW